MLSDPEKDKKLVQMVKDEVSCKLKAWDFVQTIKKKIKETDWTPLGDCPFCGIIPDSQILQCYRENKDDNKRRSCGLRRCKLINRNTHGNNRREKSSD